MYKTYDGIMFHNKTEGIWHDRCLPPVLKYAYTNFSIEQLNKDSWYIIGYHDNTFYRNGNILTISKSEPVDLIILKGKLIDVINFAFQDENWEKQKSKYITECGQAGNAAPC